MHTQIAQRQQERQKELNDLAVCECFGVVIPVFDFFESRKLINSGLIGRYMSNLWAKNTEIDDAPNWLIRFYRWLNLPIALNYHLSV